MTRLLGLIVVSCFGLCMLPILIFAYILMAISEWANAMYELWRNV